MWRYKKKSLIVSSVRYTNTQGNIRGCRYGCMEYSVERMLNTDDTETFVLETGDLIESFSTSKALVHDNLLQAVHFFYTVRQLTHLYSSGTVNRASATKPWLPPKMGCGDTS